MPTREQPFKEIGMEFISELPESEVFNAMLVVSDRFIKEQHSIAAKTTCTAEDVADS